MDKQDFPLPGGRISFLADQPNFVETLAAWSFAEWGHYFPGETLADFVQDYQGYLSKDSIPMAVVAHTDLQPLGTAALFNNDSLPGFKHLTPWLASVYVLAEFRQRGIGQALVTRIVAEAKRLGVARLYLWTGSEAGWYQRQGWTTIATTVFDRHLIDVMKLDL